MCNQDEEDIAQMQEPLQDIKKQTQDELDKVWRLQTYLSSLPIYL